MRCRQVKAGEWVQPVRRGYMMQCCDCGLIHRLNFRIIATGRGRFIQFQAFRATRNKAKRRHKLPRKR